MGLFPFFRGARAGEVPSFEPRAGEYKINKETGLVQPTHGVSVFNNPDSVSEKGFVPHEVQPDTVLDSLKIEQRGKDPNHYEIMPKEAMSDSDYRQITAYGYDEGNRICEIVCPDGAKEKNHFGDLMSIVIGE